MNYQKRIVLLLIVGLAVGLFAFASGTIKWKRVDFRYHNGNAWSHATGDIIKSTQKDTIYFSLDPDLYPLSLNIMVRAVDMNNGENMTIRLDKGAFGGFVTGTLDTAVVLSTGGIGLRQYDFSTTNPPPRDFRLILAQLGSAAATDSLSYRVSIRQKVQE